MLFHAVICLVLSTLLYQGCNCIKDIWLLGLFPFNGSWPGGLGQEPAVQMGIDDVNKDPNILPGYQLHLTVDNTQCDPGIGTNALFSQLYKKPKKTLVIGAGCSEVTQATAQVSYIWNLLQMSYSSASPALSLRERYKRFFRVFPPESSFNPAKIDLLQSFNWKLVGTLHERKQLFSLTTSDFLKRAPSKGIKVIRSESFSIDPTEAVKNLKKYGVRIIIGNFYETKARQIFCQAYKEKMYGAKYAWVITGFYTKEWWKETDKESPHDCTVSQLEEAISGYFTADALPISLAKKPGISRKTYKEFIDEYNRKTNNSQRTGYQEAPYGYDSAWAIADMLNRSVAYMKKAGWNRSIEDFNYNDTAMGNLFFELMRNSGFEGVSGPVLFNENGDRRAMSQIEQLQDGAEMRVGIYDPSNHHADNKITFEENRPIRWIDDKPPADSIKEKMVPKVISLGLFIGMTILAAFGIVLAILFLVFNLKYRRHRYIKMSSPNMNNIILAGAILAFLSIIFGGIDTGVVSSLGYVLMCKIYLWTLALGFSMAFGAMFSKTWRVHKIFTNKKIQRTVIKDYQLLAIVCILVALDVLILTVWEVVDPLRAVMTNKTQEQVPDPGDDNQILVPQTIFCQSHHMWYFSGALCAIKGLLLVFGAFLAYETRKVRVPALNDSKFIGMSVYNIVVLCMVGLPLGLVMKEQVDAAYGLISSFIFFATTFTICLVFVPKILNRNKENQCGTMFSKTIDTNHRKTQLSNISLDGERKQIQRLKDENNSLKQALDLSQRRIRELEGAHLNGLSAASTEDTLSTAQIFAMDDSDNMDEEDSLT